jgi:POT family proton-dependent oligopeptide transporter
MFKHHPRGLAVLFFTEMWERFGFYTLMAILVLYMEKEFGWNDSDKGTIYGVFLGMVYFIPILGGWIGDGRLGRRGTILIGAVCMTAGFAALAMSSAARVPFFFTGLGMIAFGTGILKVNMSVLVGNLYGDRHPLKDAGFNIYYMGVNVGAAIAPLAATAINIGLGSYTLSFAAASAGMVVAIVVFLRGRKHLETADLGSRQHGAAAAAGASPDSRSEDRQRLIVLGILFSIVIFFWIAFYQNGFALTLFAERSTVRMGLLKPETYQFFNPFFIVLLTPFVLRWFRHLRERGKEPSSASKIGAGMFISGFCMVIMVFASLAGGNEDQNIMSPWWIISSYFVLTIAEILVSPMGQSFVSKVAPRRLQGIMMGCWFGATAVGSFGSGLLGRSYSAFPHHQYYLLIAGLLFVSSAMVLVSFKKLNKFSS